MLRPRRSAQEPQPPLSGTSKRSWLAIASAVAIGGLTGLVGIGGGFLFVPVLRLVLGLPMRVAVATMGTGAVAGAWVGRRMPGIALQRSFAILLLVVAAGMLLDNMLWQDFFSDSERLS